MPKIVAPLTDIQAKNAKPKATPYKLANGGGLYLEVMPTGKKLWRMKFRQANGKDSRLAFGSYPETTLVQARDKRDDARKLKSERIDPGKGLIHQSDRGSQYCADDYRKLIKQFGMLASMSHKGNCYDNAPMERFWRSLKNELIQHQRHATRTDAEVAIQEYIEIFYNRQRRHSRLGYVSPAQFAENISKTTLAA